MLSLAARVTSSAHRVTRSPRPLRWFTACSRKLVYAFSSSPSSRTIDAATALISIRQKIVRPIRTPTMHGRMSDSVGWISAGAIRTTENPDSRNAPPARPASRSAAASPRYASTSGSPG